MVKLRVKLWRDLWRLRGQGIAIAAVALCGIASFVTLRGAYEALVDARASYYTQYRFADVFASFKRAPLTVIVAARQIPGVAIAEARIVFEAALDIPGLQEPATGRLVSLSMAAGLNQIHLREGRMPLQGNQHEILISEAFSAANKLQAGMDIHAVINGRRDKLHITGIAISPEYISEIRGNSFPDNRRFGVLWMDREALAGLLAMRDGCNDMAIRLAPGASEPEVIRHLDNLLSRYGGLGAIGRDEQLSHRFLENELAQTRVSASIIPAIFLGVAAFLIHNVLLRLTALQRAQIGLLKSFGYRDFQVGLHYLQFAMLTVAVGGLAGIALGGWLGSGLAHLYARFYHFPSLHFELSAAVIASAALMTILAAALGASLAVQRVLRLTPAEAMRTDTPGTYTAGWMDKTGLQRWMALPLRMVLRNLARQRLKTGLTILGLALSGALMITGQFSFDSLNEIIRLQFRIAQRDDVTVTFNEIRNQSVMHQVATLPGVLRAEEFLTQAVVLHFMHRQKRTALTGLGRQRQLRLTLDENEKSIELPDSGLILSRALADILHAKAGDAIIIEFLTGRRQHITEKITLIIDEPIGSFAYMDLTALNRLLQQEPAISGALLAVDPLMVESLYRTLKATPSVSSVSLREATLQSFLDTVAENIRINNMVLIGFACVIVAGVIYNSARIALSEQATELASLRILGFSQREVAQLLLTEQALLTLLSLPLACGIGYALAALIAHLLSQELFRIPLVVSPRTYFSTVAVRLISAAASALLIWQRLKKQNLIDVLKTRE